MSNHIDLMRLHDGELSEEEAAELELELSESELRVLQGLEDLGERIRVANGHESLDLTDSIMARLDEPPAPEQVTPELVKPAPVRELRPRSNGAWVAGGLALAAAAVVAFWFTNRSHEAPPVAQKPETVVAPAPSPKPLPTEAVAELAVVEDEDVSAPAASIEAVDFGNGNGTIFMVPSGEETTPVVWLADESGDSRMEPL
jgi:hypothetical protein